MISGYTEIGLSRHKTEPLLRFTIREVFCINDEPVDSVDLFDVIISEN